ANAGRPPIPTHFPYTTLFRSAFHAVEELVDPRRPRAEIGCVDECLGGNERLAASFGIEAEPVKPCDPVSLHDAIDDPGAEPVMRSEEHTSELQSRENLVCRLL